MDFYQKFSELEEFDGISCPHCGGEAYETDRTTGDIVGEFNLPPDEADRVLVRRYLCDECDETFYTGELDGIERLMEKPFIIINMTPHDVVLYDRNDCVVLPDGKGYGFSSDKKKPLPLMTFPPSGEVARATQQEEALPPVIGGGIEIPVSRMTYDAPVGLPKPSEGVAYIVSALTANAAKAAGRTTDDLYLTQGMIREGNGIVGCVGFAQL